MKSRSEIWRTALEELGRQCSVDTARDAETCERRATQEGDSFFKVTLPQFAKDLERSLAAGHVPTDSFVGWARSVRTVHVVSDAAYVADDERSANEPDLYQLRVGGGNPRFLGGFLDLVFVDDRVVSKSTWDDAIEWLLHEATDRKMPNHVKQDVASLLPPTLSDLVSDGVDGARRSFITPAEQREIDDAASAIHAIRQLCLMFSKEKELPAQRDIDNEIARFVEIDDELEETLMQGVLPGIDATPNPVQRWAENGQRASRESHGVENFDILNSEVYNDDQLQGYLDDLELPEPDLDDGTDYSDTQWRNVGLAIHQGSMTPEQETAWMSLHPRFDE